MKQGWRWYGDRAPISLKEIRQAGVTDVVAALYEPPVVVERGEAKVEEAIEDFVHVLLVLRSAVMPVAV